MGITAIDISKQFNGQWVLKDLSHSFPDSSITCIMGPSGCGKTTLLRILMGLLPPDSGHIEGTEGKRFSAVFQEDRLCENLSPISNIKFICGKAPSITKTAEQALEQVGLSDSFKKPVRELSGGMKRRVSIVRALLAPFDILFLDEPFKGLDNETRKQVLTFFQQRIQGKTVISVSHDPAEADLMGAELFTLS